MCRFQGVGSEAFDPQGKRSAFVSLRAAFVIRQRSERLAGTSQLGSRSLTRSLFINFFVFVFCSNTRSSLQGKSKYVFKQRLFVSDVGVSEVNDAGSDECKFAIWSNRSSSIPDGKIILKVISYITDR